MSFYTLKAKKIKDMSDEEIEKYRKKNALRDLHNFFSYLAGAFAHADEIKARVKYYEELLGVSATKAMMDALDLAIEPMERLVKSTPDEESAETVEDWRQAIRKDYDFERRRDFITFIEEANGEKTARQANKECLK